MMKKSLILGSIVVGIFTYFFINIFNSADNHVTTIDENVHLKTENQNLKDENSKLISENQDLKTENQNLYFLTDSLSNVSAILPKAIKSIKNSIKEGFNWATPDYAYEELMAELKRKPTKDEYKTTLKELLNSDMLYHSGYPDPSSKGKKVQNSEISELVNKLAK